MAANSPGQSAVVSRIGLVWSRESGVGPGLNWSSGRQSGIRDLPSAVSAAITLPCIEHAEEPLSQNHRRPESRPGPLSQPRCLCVRVYVCVNVCVSSAPGERRKQTANCGDVITHDQRSLKVIFT
uniref:Uncharacterized protein n=1 Tax=Knipowitschia caucasica TaxID=637954 RepID=A0AAV2MIV7_KNICA